MGSFVVRGLVLGEGRPKICAPLVGAGLAELEEEARLASAAGAELAEWRADFISGRADGSRVEAALRLLRRLLPDTPLLFTCRTRREGGEAEDDAGAYAALNEAALESGLIDLIDVELFTEESVRDAILARARERGVRAVVSSHDFRGTPSVPEMVARLEAAAALGDVAKLAVMPRCAEDVARLLLAAAEARRRLGGTPLVALSMAGLGAVTRLAGEAFGSAFTFGTAKASSAPGQLPIGRLRAALELLHEAAPAGTV